MSDDLYKLEGTVRIPDNKKAEFNRYILQILDVCGIRKTERMELDGRTITVVRRPAPDGQGIVSFDYSIVYHDEIMKEYATQQLKTERKRIMEAPIPPFRTSEFLRQDGVFTFYEFIHKGDKMEYRAAVKLLRDC